MTTIIAKTLSPSHAAQIEARCLDPELAVKLGLWTEPAKGSGDPALVFPFFRSGEIVNRKYRTSIAMGDKGKIWQDKGGQKAFWNEDILRDGTLLAQPLVITEGEFDALTAIQCGYVRAVSVPDGAPKEAIGDGPTIKYAFLDAAKPLIAVDRVSEIILAVDGDEPGAALLHDLSIRLGKFRCKWVTYPMARDRSRRLKDLNEVLVEYGQKGVVETLQRAQWLRVDGVFKMSELPPVAPAVAFDCGFPKLRENFRVRLGDFTVVTGIPSMGKSTWVNDLVCRLVQAHDLGAAFASFEQMPQRDHRRNLRTWFIGRPTDHATPSEIAAADQWIDRHFTFIVGNDEEDVTMDWLLDRLEAAVCQRGAKVLVIDPWNEMDHLRNREETLTEYTGRAIKSFRRFARKFNVHLIIVAHPSKQQKDQDGGYRIPTLYDISDSSHWYNKADVGIVVHRQGEETIIRVAKSRYHDEIGKPGEVKANFHFEKRRFEIVETPW
jgi:twinkle protein